MIERKKLYLILGILGFLLILAIVFIYLRLAEDVWIYDSKGVWIKHGRPLITPDYVLAQQKAIACAYSLYNQSSIETFSSQCLGSCDAYVVDIVHVPRTEEDDLEQNQCEAFRRRQLTHFIELDNKGNIVRIV